MLRKLVRHAAVYAVGTAAVRGIGIVLIPLYTHTLSVAEYGALETALAAQALLLILYNSGISQAVVRYWGDAIGVEARNRIFWTSTILALGIATVGVLATLVSSVAAMGKLASVGLSFGVVAAVATSAGLRSVHQQLSAVFRAMQRVGQYVLMQVCAASLWVGTCIYWMGVHHGDVTAALWSQAIGFGTIGLLALWLNGRNKSLTLDRRLSLELLRFGAPLIASMSAWFVLNASDRFFLAAYHNLRVVGEYSLGYRVASLHALGVVTPLQLALGPLVFEAARQSDVERRLARVAELCAWMLCISAAVIAMLAPVLVDAMSPDGYQRSILYAYVVLPSGLFLGAYYWAASVLHLHKRTATIAFSAVAAALLNAGLNVALVPGSGAIGAAIATDVAVFSAAVAVVVAALKVQPLRIRWYRLAVPFLIGVFLYWLGIALARSQMPTLYKLSLNGGALLTALLVALFMIAGPRLRVHFSRATP